MEIRTAAAALAIAALAGCSTPQGETRAAGPSPDRVTANHAAAALLARPHGLPLPQERRARLHARAGASPHGPHEAMAVVSGGGPVMTAPKVVPVLFAGNPYDADVRDFLTRLPGSDYWTATTSEYGVGPVTVLPPYVPAGPAPTFAGTDAWLQTILAAPPPGLPAPDNNTVYALVFPPGWDAADGACVTFGGDHWFTSMPGGQKVIYTQNPVCDGYLGIPAKDGITNALSHELVESATDPFSTAYAYVNWAASGWASAAEGSPFAELADLCEFQSGVDYVDPQLGHLVQRSWSNRSLAAGHDPCLPLLPGRPVYFNTDALVPDGTQVYPFGYAKGISLPYGREVTIPIRLSADGPIGAWDLSADEEPNPHLNPDVYKELSFSWDYPHGRSGDVRHLTVRRSAAPDGGAQVFLRVAITSTSGTTTNKSWLVVGTE